MTKWRRGPELDGKRAHEPFDPVAEGARYKLPRELSLAIWERACADVTDGDGRRDTAQAQQRFHENACRIAARGGRLRPDVGRMTRVGIELGGEAPGPWGTDELAIRTPGRDTLVAVEARRWAQSSGEPAIAREDAETAGGSAAADAAMGRPELPGAGEVMRAIAALQHPALRKRGSAGAALPRDVAARLGPYVGNDAAGAARLHTDDTADRVTAAHHARALSVGNDIYFARGEYAPGTARGDELLVHELTHVAQAQRGELARAAAKGLDSGDTLDPAEAEADLRARLAVLQLHAPEGAAPALAAPSGQPASDGDRAAMLVAQQQRLDLANQDTPPDDAVPAPPAWAPQAPAAHPPPELTAAPAPASTRNAYVETFDAPPSQQATELWDQAGTQATTQAVADQAAFDGALPPLPVVLDGGDLPDAAGGGAGDAAPTSTPTQPPAAGATPPAATPTPTPTLPPATAGDAAASAVQPGTDTAQQQADARQALNALPTTLPDGLTNPGTAPMTELAGQADPMRAIGDRQHAAAEGAAAFEAEKQRLVAEPGAARVQPVKLDERLEVPAAQAAGAMPALVPVDGMAKFKAWNLPANAQAPFDDVAKPRMDASLAEAKAKMAEAEVKRDTDRAQAVDDAHAKVTQAHADADQQQQARVAATRTQIANHQADTLLRQQSEVQQLDQLAGDRKKATIGQINDRLQGDQAKVDADYRAAQTRAEEQRQQGEADVARRKQEAQDQAGNQSWWDQIASAIGDAIQAIADEINQALDAIGQAIGAILDEVKNAACQLIDAARDFVCQALTEFGDWLQAAVTATIGSVFPELAAALNQLIDEAVTAATEAVTAIADSLKQAVTALCDGLKAAIDAAIAVFKAAVQAAVTFAQAVMTGDWSLVARMVLDGILSALGIDPAAFYALIGQAEDSIEKIIDDPGAFVGHLIDAVKLGFQQFGTNFWTHLQAGMVQWLFGTFAEAGIRMPASFDIAGIFDLVAQVLGLTWERLRGKVVNLIGEENTERLEFVAQYVQALITGGFAGLWEKIQQDLSSLWDMVVGGIKDWLIQNVVQQAILKIATMWNPAGAIFELIQTAWNAYQWLRENAQRIFGLVQAVVDSVSNIVAGDISGAANWIEQSLAQLVPIAISLFADLIGLGGIAGEMRRIIEDVQQAVDEAIDALIARVMAMFAGKDSEGDGEDDDAEDGEPEVPESLVEPSPVTLTEITPALTAALAEAPSDTVLYQASTTDPEEVTRNLLDNHPEAQLDPESRRLTLPQVSESALTAAQSLQALGQTIAEQTGVSKVTLAKTDGQAELHGHINPDTVIARLIANQLTEDDRAKILEMLKRVADTFWNSHLNRATNPNRAAHNTDMERMRDDAATQGATGPNGVYLPSTPADDLRLAANQRSPSTTQDVLHAPLEPDATVTSQTRQGRGGLTAVVDDQGNAQAGLRYNEIVASLSAHHTPQAVARALDTLRNGGGIDPEFSDQADELAVLRNLLFNVEVQRDRRNLIFSPMTTDLMSSGVPMSDLLSSQANQGLHPATMEAASAGFSSPTKPFFGRTFGALGEAGVDAARAESHRRQIDLLTMWFQAQLDAGNVPAEGSLEDLEGFIQQWVEAHYDLAAQETGSEQDPDGGEGGE